MSKSDPLRGLPVEAMSLFIDMFRFTRAINDLPGNVTPFGTIMLSVILLYDVDGRPMTADDVALFFGDSRKQVDRELKRLMKVGVIALDGDRYRYTPKRPLTEAEEREMDNIARRFEALPGSVKSRKPDQSN
ncbi:hypothetical protein ACRQ5Q_15365 [Bradyrhizobium sp. PMVTL-01]|uniref:hypothetical protein n=1 Tax=Bradyrhizobium sp. PMVTL-01 TaxID=3434999 RepID=UPI003F70F174